MSRHLINEPTLFHFLMQTLKLSSRESCALKDSYNLFTKIFYKLTKVYNNFVYYIAECESNYIYIEVDNCVK